MPAARAVSPPRKLTTSGASTGTIIPSASMSSITVMKMKTSAAGRGRARMAGAVMAVEANIHT